MFTEKELQPINDLCHRYKSHLDFEQLEEGVANALANARAIYQDAVLLLDNQRFGRAYLFTALQIDLDVGGGFGAC